MTDWTQPTNVDDLQMAFPSGISSLMPSMDEIPEEFHTTTFDNEWNKWQTQWFFNGLKESPEPKDGIDQKQAMRHLATIQGSFEPKHEHKEAAVAYLASLWFVAPSASRKS